MATIDHYHNDDSTKSSTQGAIWLYGNIKQERKLYIDWFWLTTNGEHFTNRKRSIQHVKDMEHNGDNKAKS